MIATVATQLVQVVAHLHGFALGVKAMPHPRLHRGFQATVAEVVGLSAAGITPMKTASKQHPTHFYFFSFTSKISQPPASPRVVSPATIYSPSLVS